ncbi:MAG: sulfatase [Puniceicoccaceae bacterium]
MKRITALILLSAITAFAYAGSKPNILMIAIDDLNDWIGVYGGHPQAVTPNIDKLAETSMVFRNASCAGPVCGPSRSALLSGFMPATTGIYGNGNNMLNSPIVQTHATMPEYFSKNGYVTISSGKIFHKHTTSNGFDHGHWAYDVWYDSKGGGGLKPETFYSRDEGIIAGKKLKDPKFNTKGGSPFAWGATEKGKEVTKDYNTAKWFEDQLEKDYDKPFFMLMGISKPHLTWVVPQEYFDLYDLETLEVPDYQRDDLDDIVDENGKPMFKPHQDFLWVEHYGLHKEAVQAYLAASSYADDCVGVTLDALAKSKYADNTIVILWGDHGWHLGEKLKFRKASLWRESTQLPLIVHVPGMDEMQDCFRNVNLIDLYPTLIDLSGLPGKQLDGKSFKPLLENPELKWTPTVTTRGPGAHSVMGEKWHYITYGNGVEELYNLEKDPMEWTNLANARSPEYEQVKKYMRSFLPKQNAPVLAGSDKDKSIKELDTTIKPRRVLAELK